MHTRSATQRAIVFLRPDEIVSAASTLLMLHGMGAVAGPLLGGALMQALGPPGLALHFLLTNDVSGPVNLVAPNSVTNRQLTKAIGEVLNRPTVIPTPTFGIRLLYGEMGVTLATASQRVVPDVLTEAGFTWEDTDVRSPLREALA